jgi:putative acetyltransferase
MIIRRGTPHEAEALLRASHALMESLFPAESNHYLGIDALCVPTVHFFVAEDAAQIIGCGAISVKDTYAELKSMFTSEAARGKGAAAAVLSAIEDYAKSESIPTLKLETGDLLHSAHRLYERAGFTRCDAFGDYPAIGTHEARHSVYMEKHL